MSAAGWVVVLSLFGGCLEVFGILSVLGVLDSAQRASRRMLQQRPEGQEVGLGSITSPVDVRRLEIPVVLIILGVLCQVTASIVGSGAI